MLQPHKKKLRHFHNVLNIISAQDLFALHSWTGEEEEAAQCMGQAFAKACATHSSGQAEAMDGLRHTQHP